MIVKHQFPEDLEDGEVTTHAATFLNTVDDFSIIPDSLNDWEPYTEDEWQSMYEDNLKHQSDALRRLYEVME